MPRVYIHSVLLHGLGDLVDDALPCCLHSQALLYFCDVIGVRSLCIHSRSAQNSLESQSLSIDDMPGLALLANEGTIDSGDASYDHVA